MEVHTAPGCPSSAAMGKTIWFYLQSLWVNDLKPSLLFEVGMFGKFQIGHIDVASP
jgi:hypothetical protein